MIECLTEPTRLDNDVAVMKIINLLGQLSEEDLAYVLKLLAKVYTHIK